MQHCCSDYDDDLCYRERLQYPAHCTTCSCRKSELEVTHKITQYSTPSCRKASCHCLPELICCCPCDNNLLDCDLCLCYECRKVRGRSEASIHRKEQRTLDTHHSPCHEHRCTHVTLATQHPVQQIKCKCGQKGKVIPFIKHEDLAHSSKKKVFKSKRVPSEFDGSEELPTMSKNRDDII